MLVNFWQLNSQNNSFTIQKNHPINLGFRHNLKDRCQMPPNVFYQRFIQKNIITKNQQNSSKNFEPLHLSYAQERCKNNKLII